MATANVTVATAPEVVDASIATSSPTRVLSVDVLRGLTLALMILVNDAGDSRVVFTQLEHVEWNGWTLTDLVFPTFLFLVGTATIFSLASRTARGDCRRTLAGHIVARAAKIILLDWVLAFFPRMDGHHLRLYGVLTRIGLCYLVAGLFVLAVVPLRRRAAIIAGHRGGVAADLLGADALCAGTRVGVSWSRYPLHGYASEHGCMARPCRKRVDAIPVAHRLALQPRCA